MAQFKLRFVTPATTDTAGFAARWQRRLSAALLQLRTDPARFFYTMLPQVAVFRVYAIDTETALQPIVIPEVVFGSLTDGELRSVSLGDPDFRERHGRRLERFGAGRAFAARHREQVTHVSWLLTSEVSMKEELTVLRLNADEAEITGCETKEQYRGKGIYRFVIRELIAHSATLGIKTVFMKTTPRNKASQRGIQGAGLTHAGGAIIANVPGRNIKPLVLTWMR